jgi:CRP-like cAMP-binding protein
MISYQKDFGSNVSSMPLASVFAGLSNSLVEKLEACKSVRSFKKGFAIMTQGFPVPGYFYSAKGRWKYTVVDTNGGETVIGISRPGDFVGYLKDNAPYTIEALEDCQVYFYPKEAIQDLLSIHPELSVKLLENAFEQSQQSQLRLAALMGKSVRERVSMVLSDLAENHGKPSDGAIEISISLSRDELSSMVGVATETLIRMLSDMRDEGVLMNVGRRMYVLKPEKLRSRMPMTV